jgi:hypothetical protein
VVAVRHAIASLPYGIGKCRWDVSVAAELRQRGYRWWYAAAPPDGVAAACRYALLIHPVAPEETIATNEKMPCILGKKAFTILSGAEPSRPGARWVAAPAGMRSSKSHEKGISASPDRLSKKS